MREAVNCRENPDFCDTPVFESVEDSRRKTLSQELEFRGGFFATPVTGLRLLSAITATFPLPGSRHCGYHSTRLLRRSGMVLMCDPPRAVLFDKTNRQSRGCLRDTFASKQSVCPREIGAADHVKVLQLKLS